MHFFQKQTHDFFDEDPLPLFSAELGPWVRPASTLAQPHPSKPKPNLFIPKQISLQNKKPLNRTICTSGRNYRTTHFRENSIVRQETNQEQDPVQILSRKKFIICYPLSEQKTEEMLAACNNVYLPQRQTTSKGQQDGHGTRQFYDHLQIKRYDGLQREPEPAEDLASEGKDESQKQPVRPEDERKGALPSPPVTCPVCASRTDLVDAFEGLDESQDLPEIVVENPIVPQSTV